MPLSKDEITHLAGLARLQLTPRETESLSVELPSITKYFTQIETVETTLVDTEPIRPAAENMYRDDVARGSLARAEALRNAPQTDGEFFLVPKVIG